MTDSNWTFFDPNEGKTRDIGDDDASEIIGVDSDVAAAEAGDRVIRWQEQFLEFLQDENGDHSDEYHEINGRFTGKWGVGVSTTGVVTLLSNEAGNWYPTLSAGVGGMIECIPLSIPSDPASELCTTHDDRRFVPLALWVNEEFTYTTDGNGDRLALNPFASLLLGLQQNPFGHSDIDIYGDVVITSDEVDDEGDTLGLDWRAAYSIGFFLALAEPIIRSDTDAHRARKWRMIPNDNEDSGFEFRPADVFAMGGE